MRRPAFCACLLALGLLAQSFPPSDVKILGDLRYGQTSNSVECSRAFPYYAFVFNGKGGERVDVVVKSENRSAFVALADPSLNRIASGTTHLTATLPNRGPDQEGFYIVFRDSQSQNARFTVALRKLTPGASQ